MDANDEPYMMPCGKRNLGHFGRCVLPGFIFEVVDLISRVSMWIENDDEIVLESLSAPTSKSST